HFSVGGTLLEPRGEPKELQRYFGSGEPPGPAATANPTSDGERPENFRKAPASRVGPRRRPPCARCARHPDANFSAEPTSSSSRQTARRRNPEIHRLAHRSPATEANRAGWLVSIVYRPSDHLREITSRGRHSGVALGFAVSSAMLANIADVRFFLYL